MVASDVEDALTAADIVPERIAGLDEIDPTDLARAGHRTRRLLHLWRRRNAGQRANLLRDAYPRPTPPIFQRCASRSSHLATAPTPISAPPGASSTLASRNSAQPRLHDLAKCDIVYEEQAEAWTAGVIAALKAAPAAAGKSAGAAPRAVYGPRCPRGGPDRTPTRRRWWRTGPFPAPVRPRKSATTRSISARTAPRFEVGRRPQHPARQRPRTGGGLA